MDPWDHIRRAVNDRRSGSVEVTVRAAQGIAGVSGRNDLRRAARALLRAHPAMAPLWRLLAVCLDAADHAVEAARFAERLQTETIAAGDAARWIVTQRRAVVLTHSSSASVVAALGRVRARVTRVLCTASLPGGEGRALARRLERAGFAVEVVPDAGIADAAQRADVALVGGDAVTEQAVVNKLGTRLVALAARDAGIGCYAIASSAKFLPARVLAPVEMPLFDRTPLELFDGVVTERGARRPGAVRRAVARVRIPAELERRR